MRKATILAAFFCAACSNYSANLPSIKPYKMDIQQGNVVTSKMMMQLRPGMSKSQVRFIMGTPLIADSFHANRWDYVYRMQKDGKLIEQRRVILDFEDDQLKRVRGDVIPAGSGEAAPVDASAKPAVPAKPAAASKQKEKGLIDKLKFWKSDEDQAPAKLESKPELMTEPKPAPVKAQETKTAPAPQPAAEPKPAPRDEPAPQPEAEKAPAPAPESAQKPTGPESAPVEQPKAEAGPEPEPVKQPAAETKPQAKPVEQARPELRPVPQPADDLPPEDDPGYFERMLEKIGF